MLAWVMNMGFAASGSGTPPVTGGFVPEMQLGLSLLRLGGTVFALLVLCL